MRMWIKEVKALLMLWNEKYWCKWEIWEWKWEMRNMWVICEWKYDTTLKELFKYEMSNMHIRMKQFENAVDENM